MSYWGVNWCFKESFLVLCVSKTKELDLDISGGCQWDDRKDENVSLHNARQEIIPRKPRHPVESTSARVPVEEFQSPTLSFRRQAYGSLIESILTFNCSDGSAFPRSWIKPVDEGGQDCWQDPWLSTKTVMWSRLKAVNISSQTLSPFSNATSWSQTKATGR